MVDMDGKNKLVYNEETAYSGIALVRITLSRFAHITNWFPNTI